MDTVKVPAKFNRDAVAREGYLLGATQPRPLSDIAREIRANWTNVYFGAVPYLDALRTMKNVADEYGDDSGESIVLYFLANAQTWRGDTAKRIKAELQAMLDREKVIQNWLQPKR